MYIVTKPNLSVISTLLECWLLTGSYGIRIIKYTVVPEERIHTSHYLSQLIMAAASFFLRSVIFLTSISSFLQPHPIMTILVLLAMVLLYV